MTTPKFFATAAATQLSVAHDYWTYVLHEGKVELETQAINETRMAVKYIMKTHGVLDRHVVISAALYDCPGAARRAVREGDVLLRSMKEVDDRELLYLIDDLRNRMRTLSKHLDRAEVFTLPGLG